MGPDTGRRWNPTGRAAKVFAALLALLVWQVAALAVDNRLLLVGPVRVAARLWEMMGEASFWRALGFTFTRIAGGFLLALALGTVLGMLAGRFPLADTLLRPYVTTVQSVPVASFIVIALLWLSSRRLSIFISFLMVFPILYTNVVQGIRSADGDLLEMAQVFRVPWRRRLRYIYLPALRPYLTAGCRVGLGLCWKAGVAAEVIGVTAESLGGKLYDAKVYLAIADLFAWTAVIVFISAGFEKLFLRLLQWALDRAEGA